MRAYISRALCGVTCAALLTFMAACSSFFNMAEPVEVKPVHTALADISQLSDEGVYQDAVRKMKERDYSSALDFLQVARGRSPEDVRVFNALGVVYDKLGRFDLSARYYARAAKLAPGSKIVQNNIAYSATLQDAMRASKQPSVTAMAEENPQPSAVPHASEAPTQALAAIATEASSAPTAVDLASMIPPNAKAWSGVSIVDASQSGAGSEILSTIERQGWTVPTKVFGTLPQRPSTTISYPSADIAVAMSLASGLRIPSRLEVCEEGCRGIVVIVGADAKDDNANKLKIAVSDPVTPGY